MSKGRYPDRWELILTALAIVVVMGVIFAVLFGLVGCAQPGQDPGQPPDGAPGIHAQWSDAPDTRTPIEAIPWCLNSSGYATAYPCKWDTRERAPSPAWDAQAAPVGVWVTRAQGCPVGRVKTSEDNSVAWACYYAAGS